MCLNTSAVEAVKKKKEKGPENGQTATQERIVVYSEITVICMRRRETEGGREGGMPAKGLRRRPRARVRYCMHRWEKEHVTTNTYIFVL